MQESRVEADGRWADGSWLASVQPITSVSRPTLKKDGGIIPSLFLTVKLERGAT